MNRKSIRLSPEFKFFLTFPYSLGFCTEYSPYPFCFSTLNKIAESLNRNFSDYNWAFEKFSNNMPLSLRTKGGFIEGKPKKNHNIMREIVNHAFDKINVGADFTGEVKERIVYFDHGVGSANYTINGIIHDVDAIYRLQDLAMAIIGEFRRNESAIHIFKNWDIYQNSMRKSFSECNALYDMWGILSSGGVGRGPTRYIGENAILTAGNNGSMKIPFDEIRDYLAPFTGLEKSKNVNLLPHTEGVIFLSEGWDGQIAIVSNSTRTKWLMNLWQFAIHYGTILHDLDRYLYEHTLSFRRQTMPYDIKEIKQEIDTIHKIELSIDIITHEILPHNFGGILDEVQVYRGIYYNWDMEIIAKSLRNKFSYLYTTFTNLNFILTNCVQEKMNITLLIFTVLTFAGVLASIISTIDFDNNYMSIELRTFIISFGTICAVIFSIISIVLSKRKKRFGNR